MKNKYNKKSNQVEKKLNSVLGIFFMSFLLYYSCNNINEPEKRHLTVVLPEVNIQPIFHPSGKWITYFHKNLILDTTPFPRGYIDSTDTSGIWIMRIDGSEKKLLLEGYIPSFSWSPDGEWVAFEKNRQIFKVKVDTHNMKIIEGTIKQLTYKGENSHPRWSTDGTKIAWNRGGFFVSDTAGIWIMDSSGLNKHQIDGKDDVGLYAVWINENAILVGPLGLKKINLKTGNKIVLKDGRYKMDPNAYSSVTGEIVYATHGDGWWSVEMCDTMGNYLRRPIIYDDKLEIWGGIYASFSPDGEKVVFVYKFDIWIMNKDGTGKKRLTFTKWRN